MSLALALPVKRRLYSRYLFKNHVNWPAFFGIVLNSFMKKLLVVFNDLSYSSSLSRFSLELAKSTGACIHAAFVNPLVFGGQNYPFPNDLPVASDEFRMATDVVVTEEKLHQTNLKLFRETCREAGVEGRSDANSPVMVDALVRYSNFADLVLCEADKEVSELYLKELLAETRCPVLLVPENSRLPEKLVCCYDHSSSSLLAMKMFSYVLPEWTALPATVLTINPRDDAQANEEQLLSWMDCHFAGGRREIVDGNLEHELVGHIRNGDQPAVVVMGAYGRSAVSRMFHRSLAHVVIGETNALVFITHE